MAGNFELRLFDLNLELQVISVIRNMTTEFELSMICHSSVKNPNGNTYVHLVPLTFDLLT